MKLNKKLGQHFLRDDAIRNRIAEEVKTLPADLPILEIGPGDGALTEFLLDRPNHKAIEFDERWVRHLLQKWPSLKGRIIQGNALALPWDSFFDGSFAVVGNFPYNISSQLMFRVLEYKEHIPDVIGMFQREVGNRVVSTHGSKTYGIQSVLLGAYYKGWTCFEVPPEAFEPPPKVWSTVIRLQKREIAPITDEKRLRRLVKQAFGQRRKKLRNSLKGFFPKDHLALSVFDKRPEQVSVEGFLNLERQAASYEK